MNSYDLALLIARVSLVAQLVKNLPAMRETWIQSLGWEDPPEKGMATHFGILAWRIPWTVEIMGSQRVIHNLVTFQFYFALVECFKGLFLRFFFRKFSKNTPKQY